MVNKNKLFIVVVGILIFFTAFFMFSFFAKYKEINYEKNFKQYKGLSNEMVPVIAMEKALKADILEHFENKKNDVKFSIIISLLAAKYYGHWNEYKNEDMDEIIMRLKNGEKEEELASICSNYTYFKNFYSSLFSGFVGSYKISDELKKDHPIVFKKKYGLKAYSPIVYGYKTSFCDDFDGDMDFTRKKGHFGNDIAVKKGVPFVAVESGIIERCEQDKNSVEKLELKSFDGLRTYCYYNCNKEKPFAKGIKKGSVVFAGQILGYVGANDCCKKGGSKILKCPYIHFAIKLKLKDKNENRLNDKENEVFVDSFNILKFLENNKSYVQNNGKVFSQKYLFEDEIYLKEKNKNES